MEAAVFFVLLVVALLVLNIIDMVSKPKLPLGKNQIAEQNRRTPMGPGGRPLQGPALARARLAMRAQAAKARAAACEIPRAALTTAERLSK